MAVGASWLGELNVSGWTNIKAIAADYLHTVGLKEDGTVVTVGNNEWGQLNVSDWTNIKAIATNYLDTVGIKEDGTVVGAGSNWYGQLNVSGWTNIKAIATNAHHTVGLKENGTLVGVGDNSFGQLNFSGWTNIRQPICVDPASLLNSLQGLISTLPGISPQILTSLLAKVENVVAAFNSGNETAAVNILNSLLHEISAQTGKKITVGAGDTLMVYIENIIIAIQGG